MTVGGVWNVLTRRKILDDRDKYESSRLSRCLGTWDLTFLGVGSTLGVGVYVLAGHVAKESAGPAVILSFLIAAVVSIFAGLCYAEFGARVPQAGSAYVYSYVCVGEFIAFIIGWNLILEYIIGSASVCRGISIYLDSLLNNTMKETFAEIAPVNVEFLSSYFDLCAFGLACLFGVLLAFGLKKSALFNNIFTVLNLIIVLFIIIAGAFKANTDNWKIQTVDIPPDIKGGNGGFFPYGISGMLKGAATCFYGFVGFDCIATTGEEAKNPKKAIPMAIIISLAVIFLSYFGISTIVTLMWPYYLQDENSPIPHIFQEFGWEWAKWIVAIGGMFGLFASLLGSMLPLPRIFYAMASDGLIFSIFGKVSARFKTPFIGTLFAALLTGTLAGLFELGHLINMMSIGTLMAYTIVAACVLLLRYEKKHTVFPPKLGSFESLETISLVKYKNANGFKEIVNQLLNVNSLPEPTRLSSRIVGTLIMIYCVASMSFGLCLIYLIDDLINQSAVAVTFTSIFGVLMMVCLFLIYVQPKAKADLYFKVPLVPLIPCLSIFANIYLMLMLDVYTWIRFGVWMILGFLVYFLSLYFYDRGTNYVMYAQKSSLSNGHMKGNLNYAFENTIECQERVISFVPSEKITNRKIDFSDTSSVSLPTVQTVENVNKNNAEMQQNIPEEIDVFHHEIVSVKDEEFLETEPLPDNYKEIKIIELLDQVLQEEDDLHPGSMSPELSSMKSLTIYSNPVSLSPDVLSEKSLQVIVHSENIDDSVSDNNLSSDLKNNNNVVEPVSTIPIPPPIDESFFTNTGKYTKSKPSSPKIQKLDLASVSDIDPAIVDSSSQLKFGTEKQSSFMNKLNSLLMTPGTTKSMKIETFNRSHSAVDFTTMDNEKDKTVDKIDSKENEIQNQIIVNRENEKESPKEMSRQDLKEKLESLFASTPKLVRPVQRKESDRALSKDKPNEMKEEDITQLKSKENYTNTMKLRFNDVLKSIEEHTRRESVSSQSKEDVAKRNSTNLARTELSMNL